MKQQRLTDWIEGRLPDADLTLKEVRWLEKRVFDAVSKKTLAKTNSPTQTHWTKQ